MQASDSLSDQVGELVRTNKLAILIEIVLVFAPLYLGLFIGDRLGSDHLSLGGDLVLKGAPITYLGLIGSLLILWFVTRRRGVGWNYYGLTRPKSWFRTVLMALGMALVVLAAVTMVINPIINALPNLAPRDMSAFAFLAGDLPNLIINVVAMWFTAAFMEEFVWRGYLVNRLIDLQGKGTKLAWLIALVGSAVIFGLTHAYQGPVGMFKTGAIGLVLGVCYLAVGRRLWPLILAHSLIDSLDFVSHYFGG